jgi:hypothetical protein
MGAFKRAVGLDVIDVGIHVVVTGFLAGIADQVAQGNPDGVIMLILAASTIVFGVRRHRALQRQALFPETTGEVAALKVEELESRVAELEAGQQRMMELEERLDFAERLLARQPDAARLSPPGA